MAQLQLLTCKYLPHKTKEWKNNILQMQEDQTETNSLSSPWSVTSAGKKEKKKKKNT